MNKLKYALSILLAALVIAGGALIPGIAAQIQDQFGSGRVHYDTLQSIELEIWEEQQPQPMLAKLALLRSGYYMPIGNIKPNLSEAEAVQSARDQLVKFMYLGLIPTDFLNFYLSAVPEIRCDSTDEFYNVFWYISLEPMDDQTITIVLDDQSSLIVGIQYCNAVPYITIEDANAYMEPFYQIFCDTIQVLPDTVTWLDMEDAAVGVHCGWSDTVYGEITMEFAIYRDCFYATVLQI